MEVPDYLLPKQQELTTSQHNQTTYCVVQLMVTALAALLLFSMWLFF